MSRIWWVLTDRWKVGSELQGFSEFSASKKGWWWLGVWTINQKKCPKKPDPYPIEKDWWSQSPFPFHRILGFGRPFLGHTWILRDVSNSQDWDVQRFPMPASLVGMHHQTPKRKPICFNYNLGMQCRWQVQLWTCLLCAGLLQGTPSDSAQLSVLG